MGLGALTDEKAKIEVFGDSFAEHDTKWLGSVTFIEYVAGTFKHYLGRVPRQLWQAAMGSKEQPAAASGAGAKETAEAEAVRGRAQLIRPIGAEGLNRRGPAGSCRLFLGPGFRLGACWNRLVATVKTRKKREKNREKSWKIG